MVRLTAARAAWLQTMRYALILAIDATATLLAISAALLLRFDGEVPARLHDVLHVGVPLLVGVRLLAVLAAKLHCWSFRMSGLRDAVRLAGAMLVASAVVLALANAWGERVPPTVQALEFFLTTSLMAAVRFGPQLLLSWYEQQQAKTSALRTLIVGAGRTGDLLARDLSSAQQRKYFVVGFVDDRPARLGAHLDGKRVLGTVDDLPRLIAEHRIAVVLLAPPRLRPERIREILSACSASKAAFKIVPASFSFLDERRAAASVHDLSPEDLLARDAVAFDPGEIRALVAGRRALVTGAGGSIGSEICRQLAANDVAELVMVDINENELYLGARRLQEVYPSVRVHAEVADIRERGRLSRLGRRHRPEHVFHAAAHKHVPLMESAPEEAIKNNVFGTLNVARMAHECGAERFVLISTDKAVKPSSVMGASKRLAEWVVRDVARQSRTRMTAVRFGNVLGSAGSVVPIFKQQIERGGPVTVTHPDCTRYFMTIPEAVGLVLLAGLGGYGELCILDMGEPIRVADLAMNLITMAGYVAGREIPIVYTGLRPGEKLSEELLTEEEEQTHAVRNRIKVASSPPPPAQLQQRLNDLRRLADAGDREALLAIVGELIPTYRRTPGDALPAAAPTPAPLAPVLPLRRHGSAAPEHREPRQEVVAP